MSFQMILISSIGGILQSRDKAAACSLSEIVFSIFMSRTPASAKKCVLTNFAFGKNAYILTKPFFCKWCPPYCRIRIGS